MSEGQNLKVVSYRQTALDTAPTTPNGLQWPIVSCGLKMTRGRVGDPLLNGDRNATRTALGRKVVAGPTVIRPDSRSLAFMMPDLVGPTTSPAAVAGITTHKAVVGPLAVGNTIDKWSTDITGMGSVERYIGVRVNEWSFSAADEGFLQISINHMGVDEVEDDELLDLTPKLYVARGFDMALLTFNEGGTPLRIAKDYQLTVANNLDGEIGRTIGNNGVLSELPEGKIGVSFSYNVLYKSRTLINKAKNNQLSSHSLLFPGPIAGHFVKFTMNEIEYEVEEPIAEGPNGRVIPMKGTAILEADVAASSLIMEVANDVPDITTIPA